jgi:hypothetical protein
VGSAAVVLLLAAAKCGFNFLPSRPFQTQTYLENVEVLGALRIRLLLFIYNIAQTHRSNRKLLAGGQDVRHLVIREVGQLYSVVCGDV